MRTHTHILYSKQFSHLDDCYLATGCTINWSPNIKDILAPAAETWPAGQPANHCSGKVVWNEFGMHCTTTCTGVSVRRRRGKLITSYLCKPLKIAWILYFGFFWRSIDERVDSSHSWCCLYVMCACMIVCVWVEVGLERMPGSWSATMSRPRLWHILSCGLLIIRFPFGKITVRSMQS